MSGGLANLIRPNTRGPFDGLSLLMIAKESTPVISAYPVMPSVTKAMVPFDIRGQPESMEKAELLLKI